MRWRKCNVGEGSLLVAVSLTETAGGFLISLEKINIWLRFMHQFTIPCVSLGPFRHQFKRLAGVRAPPRQGCLQFTASNVLSLADRGLWLPGQAAVRAMSSSGASGSSPYTTLAISHPAEFITHVEINRPEKRNAMNTAFWRWETLWNDATGTAFSGLNANVHCHEVLAIGIRYPSTLIYPPLKKKSKLSKNIAFQTAKLIECGFFSSAFKKLLILIQTYEHFVTAANHLLPSDPYSLDLFLSKLSSLL